MPEQLKIGFYITAVLVVFFLYKKKKPRPTKLDLSSFKNKADKGLSGIRKVMAEVVDEIPAVREQKHIFLYKGKKYDALKILNLSMGAGSLEVKRAYAHKISSDEENKNLYAQAYQILANK